LIAELVASDSGRR